VGTTTTTASEEIGYRDGGATLTNLRVEPAKGLAMQPFRASLANATDAVSPNEAISRCECRG
jgi:hypothetical protein